MPTRRSRTKTAIGPARYIVSSSTWITDRCSRLPGTSRHSSTYAPLGARSIITVPSSFHDISPGSGNADTGWKLTPNPRVCHSAVAVRVPSSAISTGPHSVNPLLASTAAIARSSSTVQSRRPARSLRLAARSAAIRTSAIADSVCSHTTVVVSSREPSANSIQARLQHPNINSGTVAATTGAIGGLAGSGSGRVPRRHARR